MRIKEGILISTIIAGTNSHAQKIDTSVRILQPGIETSEGLNYDRAIEIMSQKIEVEYGEPVGVKFNEVQGLIDLLNVNGRVVTIPLDEAIHQPNKEDPTI